MIKKLNIISFGKLSNRIIELAPGINIIYGQNESGKSTLTAFIKAMLYGFSQKRGKAESERQQYMPWEGTSYGGTIEIGLCDGRNIEVGRTFKERTSRDMISVIEKNSGREPNGFLPVVGEALYGISLDTFEQTAFIGQQSAIVKSNDEMLSRLSNLVSGGNEDISWQTADKLLDEKRRALFTKGAGVSGRINRLSEQILKLDEQKADALQRHQKALDLLYEQKDLKAKIADVEASISSSSKSSRYLSDLRDAREYKEIIRCQEEIKQIDEKISNIMLSITKDDFVPDEKYIAELKECYSKLCLAKEDRENTAKALGSLSERQQALNEKLSSMGEAGKNPQIGRQIVLELAEYETMCKSYEQMNRILEEKTKIEDEIKSIEHPLCSLFEMPEISEALLYEKPKRSNTVWSAFSTIALVCCAAIAGILIYSRANLLYLAIPAAISILAAALYMINSKADKDNRLSKLMLQYGIKDREVLLKEYQEYKNICQKQGILRDRLDRFPKSDIKEEQQNLILSINEKKDFIFSALKRCNAENPSALEQMCDEARVIIGQLHITNEDMASAAKTEENAKNAYDASKEKFMSLFLLSAKDIPDNIAISTYIENLDKTLRELADQKLIHLKVSDHLENAILGKDMQRLKQAYEKLKQEQQLDSEDTIPDHDDNLEGLNKQIIYLKEREASVKTALEHIYAGKETPADIEEKIAVATMELDKAKLSFDAVCLAKEVLEESKVELEREFAPHLKKNAGANLSKISGGKYTDIAIDKDYNIKIADNKGIYRELSCFSAGTVDQTYISLRMALVELLEGENPLPVIFDDAFCQFDDTRLENILDVMNMFAQSRQILVMTCHRREAELLRKKYSISAVEI